jgi:hypothetical protein
MHKAQQPVRKTMNKRTPMRKSKTAPPKAKSLLRPEEPAAIRDGGWQRKTRNSDER